jgi:hypothetical protein
VITPPTGWPLPAHALFAERHGNTLFVLDDARAQGDLPGLFLHFAHAEVLLTQLQVVRLLSLSLTACGASLLLTANLDSILGSVLQGGTAVLRCAGGLRAHRILIDGVVLVALKGHAL